MPAAIIPAVGAVAGGIASGKGASKAAKIQAQASDRQIASLQAMYDTNKGLMTPTFDRGEAAQTQIQSLLLGDADPSETLAATPGYKWAVDQTNKSVNANAYAAGLGQSGAALKALQDRSNNLATQNYNTYVGQLGSVADRGVSAMNGLVSQGNYTTGASNQVVQSGADSASANAVYQGNNLANVIKGVANAGGQAFGSSYKVPDALGAGGGVKAPVYYPQGTPYTPTSADINAAYQSTKPWFTR